MNVLATALRDKKPKRNVVSIAAGFISGANGMALDKRGKVWGWANNFTGQIGDNSATSKLTPASILGANKTFCKIETGDGHSLGIDKNGRVWGWGNNFSGELGNNATLSRLTPVSILGTNKTFCQISAGTSFSVGIDLRGRAWGWGYNIYGQLGNNATLSRRTPVSVLGNIKTFCKISAGLDHVLAIARNGRLWSWGDNFNGPLGDNSLNSRRTPVSVLGAVKTFCQISAGNAFSLGITNTGRAWGWGYNTYGQLGNGSTTVTSRLTPVSIAGAVKTFCKISAGDTHALAIDKNGRAWGWGRNEYFQLGDNSTISSRLTPVSVAGAVKTFCEIVAGGSFSIAIDKNKGTWAWGRYDQGQLGNDFRNQYIKRPEKLYGNKTFCHIGAAYSYSVGIDKNGKIWSWGQNFFGSLGDNSTIDKGTPVSILGANKTFCKIDHGGLHSLAIDKNGRLWAWGRGHLGQLGNNSTLNRLTPVSVLGAVKTFCEISGGNAAYDAFSLAIDKNGRAWGWGLNTYGQLGNNSTVDRLTPISILGAVKTFCKISAGNDFSMAIARNGRLWTWGANVYGQLGDNSTISKRTPVSILGAIKTFCKISAGAVYSIAIDKNGRAWGWGENSSGVVGNNSTTVNPRTPVSVLGAIKTFCEISAGANHVLAIDKNGRGWGWGINSVAQLGDGTTVARATPVSIAGTVKTFCKISAGGSGNSLAIDNYGQTWAWGSNFYGMPGLNITERTPMRVCNI